MTKRQSITAAVVFAIGAAVAWWRHNVRRDAAQSLWESIADTYSRHGVEEATLMAARAPMVEHSLWEIAAFTMIVFAVAALAVGLLAERKTEES